MSQYRNPRGSNVAPPATYSHPADSVLQLQLRAVETSARLAPLCCVWLPDELDLFPEDSTSTLS